MCIRDSHQCAAVFKNAFVDVYYRMVDNKDIQEWRYPNMAPPRGSGPMPEEEVVQCKQALTAVLNIHDSEAFRAPVGWFDHDIAQYPREVGRLMDLGTVGKWLKMNAYSRPEQFATDMRQVFKNATKFNQEGSPIYQAARLCERTFEAEFAKVSSAPTPMAVEVKVEGEGVPVEEINGLAAKVHKMSSNDLIRLVDEIKAKYPNILSQPGDDELELDLDLLDRVSFTGLNQFVASL
eukprot:TRINITY_DN60113_c0_g1_i3.p1 TRINITY_DN60113_c0_g1~~TRINITY_DN60113_c0_g1_i3.p1  ORF type:complete len:236 (-),score=61.46 TRINITY_DN60113_c0_g1_i3:140-847(-)